MLYLKALQGFQKRMQNAVPPLFFFNNLLRSLSSRTICLYGKERSWELVEESGRDYRLLSDSAGWDNLHFDFSY